MKRMRLILATTMLLLTMIVLSTASAFAGWDYSGNGDSSPTVTSEEGASGPTVVDLGASGKKKK